MLEDDWRKYMNEIKLFEEIQDAIYNGTYDELLYKIELRLKKLLSKYTAEDVMTLINKTIIFHNCNMYCMEEKYAEYQRDKHIPLKILLSLPQYYYENISESEKNCICDHESVMDELIEIISELEHVYYYYPYKDVRNFTISDENRFYINYFFSYYFDYPAIEFKEFCDFFESNINLCKEVLFDNNFKESFQLMIYLQEFEKNLKQ